MIGKTAPSVSVTLAGQEPTTDVARLIDRSSRLKSALGKTVLSEVKREQLEGELAKIQAKIKPFKEAINNI